MEKYPYSGQDPEPMFTKVLELLQELNHQVLLIFDFDGVLCSGDENKIYQMDEEPKEKEDLLEIANEWNLNLHGYDLKYKRHLLYQAAAAQLGLPISPGPAFSLARHASQNDLKIFILSARSGVYAIARMSEFINTSGINPLETFHIGRVTKDKQITLMLEKFPNQHVFYFEDNSQHIRDIEIALENNENHERLHLFEIEDKSNNTNLPSLRQRAWKVLRVGLKHKREGIQMDQNELVKTALQHGRELFNYHASQRVQAISIYLAALAFLVAAVVQVFVADPHFPHQKLVGVCLCIIAFLITGFLWGIDTRNARLVELDENLLKKAEEYMGDLNPTLFQVDKKNANGKSERVSGNPENPEKINTFKIMEMADLLYSKLSRVRLFKNNNLEPLTYSCLVPAIFCTFLLTWIGLACIFMLSNFEMPDKP